MRLLLTRLPLFLGVFLLQVQPVAPTVPTNIGDLLLQTLSQVPVYAILAYIVINIQRDNSKESERRDKHEEKITGILDGQITRVDEIEEDRRKQWDEQKQADAERDSKYIETFQAFGDGMNRVADVLTLLQKNETESNRVLSDLTSGVTAIVTVGSKPLQQVVKDVGVIKDTSEEIQKVVKGLFDAYATNFPTKKPIDELFEELKKAILEAIEKKCEEKITHELPAVNMVTVNTNTPAESEKSPTADGEAA